MKLAFLVLLLANLVAFAWQRGVFGGRVETGREPDRLVSQIAPEKIRLLSGEQSAALDGAANRAPAKPACVEFGDFDDAGVERVLAKLAPLALGERLSARKIETAGWFVVYLPPQKSRAEADKLAQELRGRGVTELVVLGENSPLRNAISLGAFRDQELARAHQADLQRRGIKGVQVAERGSPAEATRFEIRGADAAASQQLAELRKEFPTSRLTACAN